MGFKSNMIEGIFRFLALTMSVAALTAAPAFVSAQEFGEQIPNLKLPTITNFALPQGEAPLAQGTGGEITLAAQLTEGCAEITRGLVWRVFKPEPGPEGKLPLVAS